MKQKVYPYSKYTRCPKRRLRFLINRLASAEMKVQKLSIHHMFDQEKKKTSSSEPRCCSAVGSWYCHYSWDWPQFCCLLKWCPNRPPRPHGPCGRQGGCQGHARKGWRGRGRAWGLPFFTSRDFGVGGKEIKGFSLNHYGENTLQSMRGHSRGSWREVLASMGKVLHPRSHCNYGNTPGLM